MKQHVSTSLSMSQLRSKTVGAEGSGTSAPMFLCRSEPELISKCNLKNAVLGRLTNGQNDILAQG